MANKVYVDLKNGGYPSVQYTYANEKVFELNPPITVEQIPTDSVDNQETKDIDEKLASNSFITPSEYYNKISDGTHGNADKNKQGYYNDNGTNDNIEIKWFWLEELKNWCTYLVYTNGNQSTNMFTLNAWNGKNGWISIANLTIRYDPFSFSQDLFGIHEYEEDFLTKAKGEYISNYTFDPDNPGHHKYVPAGTGKNLIVQGRGVLQSTHQAWTESMTPHRLQHITGIRLQKSIKYSINDQNNFQTIRWNTLYTPIDDNKLVGQYLGAYAQTNVRFPISTGIPTVWRLPSGDIFLASTFYWNADIGDAYYYSKNADGQFRKHWYKSGNMPSYKMMGDNDFAAAAWLNSLCANYFGSGNNKTIENDWLREKPPGTNDASDYSIDYTNMLDSTKSFEQHNINKENSMKCTFTVHRPNVTTEESQTSDYAKKW